MGAAKREYQDVAQKYTEEYFQEVKRQALKELEEEREEKDNLRELFKGLNHGV